MSAYDEEGLLKLKQKAKDHGVDIKGAWFCSLDGQCCKFE
jgi:hypothetical protein